MIIEIYYLLFKNFVDNLNLTSAPGLFWKIIKSFKGSHYFSNSNPPLTNEQVNIDQYIMNLSPDGVIHRFSKCIAGKFLSFFGLNWV